MYVDSGNMSGGPCEISGPENQIRHAPEADNRSKAAIDTHAIGGKHIASSIIQLFRVISRHQRNTPGNAYLRQIIISWANRIRTERVNTHLLSSRQGGAGRS